MLSPYNTFSAADSLWYNTSVIRYQISRLDLLEYEYDSSDDTAEILVKAWLKLHIVGYKTTVSSNNCDTVTITGEDCQRLNTAI